jgi:hypothetical protein
VEPVIFNPDLEPVIFNPDEEQESEKELHPVTGKPVLRNPDGSRSTEETITIEAYDLNGGAPTNIPTIWDGKRVGVDEAIRRAIESGERYPSFDSREEAIASAKTRSLELEKGFDIPLNLPTTIKEDKPFGISGAIQQAVNGLSPVIFDPKDNVDVDVDAERKRGSIAGSYIALKDWLKVSETFSKFGSEILPFSRVLDVAASAVFNDPSDRPWMDKVLNKVIQYKDVGLADWRAKTIEKLEKEVIPATMPDSVSGRIVAGTIGILGTLPLYYGGGAARSGAELVMLKVLPKIIAKHPRLGIMLYEGVRGAAAGAGGFAGAEAVKGGSPEEVGKAALLGAATGPVSSLAPVIPKLPLMPKAVQDLILEGTAYYGANAAIYGAPLTTESFAEVVGTLIGLRIVNKTIGKARSLKEDLNAVADTLTGKLTPEEIKALRWSFEDPAALEMFGKLYPSLSQSPAYKDLFAEIAAERARVTKLVEGDQTQKTGGVFTDQPVNIPESPNAAMKYIAEAAKSVASKPESWLYKYYKAAGVVGKLDPVDLTRVVNEQRHFNKVTKNLLTLKQKMDSMSTIPGVTEFREALFGKRVADPTTGQVVMETRWSPDGPERRPRVQGMMPEEENIARLALKFNDRVETLNGEQLKLLGRAMVQMERDATAQKKVRKQMLASGGLAAGVVQALKQNNHFINDAIDKQAKKLGYTDTAGLEKIRSVARTGQEFVEFMLNEAKEILIADAVSRYTRASTLNPAQQIINQSKLAKEVKRIEDAINELTSFPLYPRLRFEAPYRVTVRHKRNKELNLVIDFDRSAVQDIFQRYPKQKQEKLKEEITRYLEAFEGVNPNDYSIPEIALRPRKEFKQVSPQRVVAMDLPLVMRDRISAIVEESDAAIRSTLWSEFQSEQLKPTGREKVFGQRHSPPLGISEDYGRVMTNWITNSHRILMRIKYGQQLNEAIDKLEGFRENVRNAKADASEVVFTPELDKLIEDMRQTTKYTFNPIEEYPTIRQGGFLWYLWGVPRAALQNATQVGLVSYPVLADKFGDKVTLKELTRAMVDISKLASGISKAATPDEWRALEYWRDIGATDQGFLQQAAGVSSGRGGEMIKSRGEARRFVETFTNLGIGPFKLMEQYNRRVTGLAAYRLAKRQGMSEADAAEYGRNAIDLTQGDYTRVNRPPIMRGKGAPLFLFKMYPQMMMRMMWPRKGGKWDPVAGRVIATMIAAAGIEGLPGFDLATGTTDALVSAFAGYPTSSKEVLTQALEDTLGESDMVMRGMAGDGFGIPAMLREMGMDIPDVDFSGSVGLNRLGFGLEESVEMGKRWLASGGDLSSEEFTYLLKDIINNGLGSIWLAGNKLFAGMASDDPFDMTAVSKSGPTSIRNWIQGYNISNLDLKFISEFVRENFGEVGEYFADMLSIDPRQRHVIATRANDIIAEFSNEERAAAAVLKALGFQMVKERKGHKGIEGKPDRPGWENYIKYREFQEFWRARKMKLGLDAWQTGSRLGFDSDEFKEVINQILDFNAKVSALGVPELGFGKEFKKWLERQFYNWAVRGEGFTPEERYIPSQQKIYRGESPYEKGPVNLEIGKGSRETGPAQ